MFVPPLMGTLVERPRRAVHAPPVPEEDWNTYKSDIRDLYLEQRRKLDDVMDVLSFRYGFRPSKHQYTLQLAKWGFSKYVPRSALRDKSQPESGASVSQAQSQTSLPPAEVAVGYHMLPNTTDIPVESAWSKRTVQKSVAPQPNSSVRPRVIIHYPDTTHEARRIAGSLLAGSSIASVSGDGHSLSETSPATVASSRSSTEDLQMFDVGLEDAEVTTEDFWRRLKPIEQDSIQLPSHLKKVPSSATEDDSDEGALNAPPFHVVDMLPATHISSSTRHKTSPLFLLRNVDLLEQKPYPVTMSDLEQIEELGALLFGARSHEDSFSIFRIFMMQTTALPADIAETFPFVLRGAVHLAKSAITNEDRARVIEILKTFTPETLNLNSSCSIQGCLLYSYLGNCYRLQGNVAPAEKYCGLAVCKYRAIDAELRRPGFQAIIMEHLILLEQERSVKKGEDPSIDSRVAKIREEHFGLPNWKRTREVNAALAEIFHWCSALLLCGPFAKEIRQADGALWTRAPSETQLADFLSTLLFCYLWKRLYGENNLEVRMMGLGAYQAAFLRIKRLCGISPIETLAAVARMIISGVSIYAQPAIAGAAAGAATKIAEQRHLHSMDVFLDAYVAPLREQSPRFTSDIYMYLVQNFLRHFVEENLNLQLSENAFDDHRMRPQLVQGSILPCSTATMLPTPHSSWNKSTTSFSRRLSSMIKNPGQMSLWSASSSPHWSRRSMASMATSVSSRLSARFPSMRTSTMELLKDSPENIERVNDHTYISAPTLVSTTIFELTEAGYASEYAESENILDTNEDPMDIDW